MTPKSKQQRFITIFSLVFAGEAVFFLPFVMARIFRPTLLDFFEIDNTQLGYYFSIYGIVAMVSYLFGGILADRIQPRKLMTLALVLTASAGLVIAIFPKSSLLGLVYGWWGFTSIFLFWAAMIRATREWGGEDFQGRAFGWLEGGRGATAAFLGTLTFILFTFLSVNNGEHTQNQNGLHPFQYVVILTSALTIIAGALIWFFVPDSERLIKNKKGYLSLGDIKILIQNPGIWLLSIMIICAYVGYKITDDFSMYAKEVLGFSESGAAGLSTAALWLRAMVAVMAGIIGDRFSKRSLISWLFFISMISGLFVALGLWTDQVILMILNFVFVAVGIYGVRALYFAVFKEARIDVILTGSAVGLVSFVGYTPDIFMGPWMGSLLDNHPGEYGHRLVFWLLTGFSVIGWFTSRIFYKLHRPLKA